MEDRKSSIGPLAIHGQSHVHADAEDHVHGHAHGDEQVAQTNSVVAAERKRAETTVGTAVGTAGSRAFPEPPRAALVVLARLLLLQPQIRLGRRLPSSSAAGPERRPESFPSHFITLSCYRKRTFGFISYAVLRLKRRLFGVLG